ncbi:MAG TPA: hypothetical protein PK156_01380 [Polyangium sp.]|nr:hypothetical protein [Polyangium sp.]
MNNDQILPLILALSLPACGAPPPPVATKPFAYAIPLPVEVAAAAPATPLSDTAPKDMTARIHAENLDLSWNNAERLLRVIGVPIPSVPPDILAVGLLGSSVASIVDFTRPVDVAFFGADFERFAVGVPVAAEMQPRLGKLFQLRPDRGLLRIERHSDKESEGDAAQGALGACAFVGAEEESMARVVCASDDELLDSVGLYLGRTVTHEGRDGDVRLELTNSRLFEQIANEAGDDEPKEWAQATGERHVVAFFRDIERLSLVGSWGKTDIEAEAVLGFRTNMSGFSQALSARVPLQSPSTVSFLRLPKDAVFAMHGHAGNAQALVPLRDEFMRSLRSDLESDGYDAALLETFNQRVTELVFTGGSYALAYGIDRLAAEKALAAYAQDKKKPALRSTAYRSLRGWSMFAVDEPTEKWTKGIEDLVRVGNELDRKRNGAAATTGTTPAKSRKQEDRVSTTMTVAAVPSALPKGSLHIEIRSKPLKKDSPPAYMEHLFVVPDGTRTWIGFGEDEAPMLGRLRAAREGLSDQTIAGMPELANAAAQGAVAAGYFTLAGGSLLFMDDDSDEKLDDALVEMELLGMLPGRGDGVIPWQIVSEDAQNGGGRARMKAKFSLPVLGDIAVMAKR